MDDGRFYNLYKLLKQRLFSDNEGRWRPLSDVGRGCGDASRALLFLATGLISKRIQSIPVGAALVPAPGSGITAPSRD
jgi:hypothetical protein